MARPSSKPAGKGGGELHGSDGKRGWREGHAPYLEVVRIGQWRSKLGVGVGIGIGIEWTGHGIRTGVTGCRCTVQTQLGSEV